MANYIVGYDLNRPGQNYPELFEAIKKLGTNWWHCLDSTWIVVTTKNATQIRDQLSPHIDRTDELLVAGLSNEAAWVGFDAECSNWLKSNLK
jgi:hypothetical protein